MAANAAATEAEVRDAAGAGAAAEERRRSPPGRAVAVVAGVVAGAVTRAAVGVDGGKLASV